MRNRVWILGLCLFFCLAFILPVASRADFGSFAGDSDYGSSGGSDSSWSGSDRGDYSYGGSSSGIPFDELPPLAIVALIAFMGVFIWCWIPKVFRFKRRRKAVPAGAQRTADSQLIPMERYQAVDPGFNRAAFTEKMANIYMQMQNGWQNKNIEPVRPYLTDALFSQMELQLGLLRRKGHTNYVERIAVLGVLPRGYYQTGTSDHIIVELRARIVDYTLEDRAGKLVSGDPKKERFMTYEWDLVRPSGITTAPESAMTSVRCPSCGSPLPINQSAKCSYCGSVVTLKKHDWAIFAIKGIAQETK